MNIDGLNMVNTFAGYEAKKIVANPAKTVNSFVSILNNTTKENAMTINSFSKEDSLLKSSHSLEDDVVESSELEDKYCSLCGSRIKEDGSCPICITPTFISGNRQSRGQNVSQADNSHMVTGKQLAVSSGNNKVGRKM
jgi:hypothetical protein